jgi:phosphoribosylamine-glycine ligase
MRIIQNICQHISWKSNSRHQVERTPVRRVKVKSSVCISLLAKAEENTLLRRNQFVCREYLRYTRHLRNVSRSHWDIGISVCLYSSGILSFKPVQQAAQIKASKEFAKYFMQRNGRQQHRSFTVPYEAVDNIQKLSGFPLVLCCPVLEAVEACQAVDESAKLPAGAKLIVEELLERKFLYIITIIQPVIGGLSKEDITYKDVLYAGLKETDNGIKGLEFNCQFDLLIFNIFCST